MTETGTLVFWILLFVVIKNKLSASDKLKKQIASHRLISVFGILGSLLMLGLSFAYYTRIKDIEGFTEMYHEYSVLLFNIGSVFLIYSGIVTFFRIFKKLSKNH